jgi:hypothetical protein
LVIHVAPCNYRLCKPPTILGVCVLGVLAMTAPPRRGSLTAVGRLSYCAGPQVFEKGRGRDEDCSPAQIPACAGWLKSLKRRSQKAYMSWERFTNLTDRFFPPIRVRHPLPCHRFDARIRGKIPMR